MTDPWVCSVCGGNKVAIRRKDRAWCDCNSAAMFPMYRKSVTDRVDGVVKGLVNGLKKLK